MAIIAYCFDAESLSRVGIDEPQELNAVEVICAITEDSMFGYYGVFPQFLRVILCVAKSGYTVTRRADFTIMTTHLSPPNS